LAKLQQKNTSKTVYFSEDLFNPNKYYKIEIQ